MARKRKSKASGGSWRRKTMRIVKKVIISWFAVTFLWVLLMRFINPPVTWLMIQRGFERKTAGKSWKIEKNWIDAGEMPRNLKLAAMAGEDAHFLSHWGFDINAIEKAYEKNQQGKKLSGGSTLSQQTAKNVFLWPGRSWVRKGFETYFTLLIELLWSKERIMEVYLNVVETGDGLYGAEAAAWHYFHKPAAKLTRNECALIIAILPNPRRWSAARPTAYIYRYQGAILRNMSRLNKAKI
jgi:monofunctional biosynthetic peptidoglycan transglycosylase